VKFSDLDLMAVGQEIQLVGGIWAGAGREYLCYFPDYGAQYESTDLPLTPTEWEALLKQSDQVETEVTGRAVDGTPVKAILRKCQRNIELGVSWEVYRRDSYQCRYCGNDQVPLTVDHLVLWEEGGSSIANNLVSACRKCNKTRGRLPYREWLHHPYYRDVASPKLTPAQRLANAALADTLDAIPRLAHVRSR
jgi:5-methylcytosine-specific restriction endonuclease McrA